MPGSRESGLPCATGEFEGSGTTAGPGGFPGESTRAAFLSQGGREGPPLSLAPPPPGSWLPAHPWACAQASPSARRVYNTGLLPREPHHPRPALHVQPPAHRAAESQAHGPGVAARLLWELTGPCSPVDWCCHWAWSGSSVPGAEDLVHCSGSGPERGAESCCPRCPTPSVSLQAGGGGYEFTLSGQPWPFPLPSPPLPLPPPPLLFYSPSYLPTPLPCSPLPPLIPLPPLSPSSLPSPLLPPPPFLSFLESSVSFRLLLTQLSQT